MIKIIKEGKKPKKYKTIYTITCPSCGCEFECEDSDFTSREKKLNGEVSIKCPCCEEELTFLSRDVLKSRQEEIKEDEDNYTPQETSQSINQVPSISFVKFDKDDPCKKCINRFGPIDDLGNPIVGDSPCQWCSHYKNKITCDILGE